MNISISISNKIATITAPTYAVCDNTDYTVVFTFDSEWAAYTTKTARFAYSGGHYDAVFNGNSVVMPKIENADLVLIGVFAGDLHTTTPAKLPMVRSILHSKGGVICPTDHVYDQVLEQLNHKVTEPSTEGTSGQVLTTDGAGGRSWTTCGDASDHAQLEHLSYADSGHTGFQPTIDDLATIRSGAALGATALQSVPDTYRTASAQDVIDAAKASSADLDNTDRSLEALWELNKGQTWDFDTDTETVYSKTIPSGSRYASVDSIGGRSVVWTQLVDSATTSVTVTSGHKIYSVINGTASISTSSGTAIAVTGGTDKIVDLTRYFSNGSVPSTTTDPRMNEVYAYLEAHPEYNSGQVVHGAVTSVEVKNSDSVVTKTEAIPSAVQALTGYGWSAGNVYNNVDYANKTYTQRVSRVDLGTLNWSFNATSRFNSTFTGGEKRVAGSVVANMACAKYSPTSRTGLDNVSLNKAISSHEAGTNTYINIRDTNYTNATAFKASLNGVMYYYELSTPIITDISSLLTDGFLTSMPCETDGSVTFKQSGTQLQVPVQNTFLVKLSEVEE